MIPFAVWLHKDVRVFVLDRNNTSQPEILVALVIEVL
jgi:hypothetical protein